MDAARALLWQRDFPSASGNAATGPLALAMERYPFPWCSLRHSASVLIASSKLASR